MGRDGLSNQWRRVQHGATIVWNKHIVVASCGLGMEDRVSDMQAMGGRNKIMVHKRQQNHAHILTQALSVSSR